MPQAHFFNVLFARAVLACFGRAAASSGPGGTGGPTAPPRRPVAASRSCCSTSGLPACGRRCPRRCTRSAREAPPALACYRLPEAVGCRWWQGRSVDGLPSLARSIARTRPLPPACPHPPVRPRATRVFMMLPRSEKSAYLKSFLLHLRRLSVRNLRISISCISKRFGTVFCT